MVSLLVAQVDMFFQVTIFVLLLVGILFGRQGKDKIHGQVTLTAAVLNVASFLAVMVPSWSSIWANSSGTLKIATLTHGFLGGVTLILSFWLVGSWLSGPLVTQEMQNRCYGATNKKVMWAVLFIWLASLIGGFFLFGIANAKMVGYM